MALFTLFQNNNTDTPSAKPEQETIQPQRNDWNLFEDGHLLIDMFEADDVIVVRALVAGIEPDQLEISLHNDMLTIRGRRNEQEDLHDDQYLMRECYWGSFSRSVIIPLPVQTNAIQATFKNGVVTIVLPKAEHDHSIPLMESSPHEEDDESPYWEDEDSEDKP